jgi:hypothetical protein
MSILFGPAYECTSTYVRAHSRAIDSQTELVDALKNMCTFDSNESERTTSALPLKAPTAAACLSRALVLLRELKIATDSSAVLWTGNMISAGYIMLSLSPDQCKGYDLIGAALVAVIYDSMISEI